MKKNIIRTARIFFAVILIVSGFVKAVDPLGSAYKFQDFFTAFDVEWLFPAALPFAVLLSTLEFVVGFAFLFGLKLRLFAPAGLILMAVFTPVTVYIALTDPVPHCGCFGDAIVISNQATAYKNLLLLAASTIVFFNRNRIQPLFPPKAGTFAITAATVLVSGLSVYSLKYLPIIDFRPWKIGSNIAELVAPPSHHSSTIYLVFENRETGETRTYPANDYPWDDPEWAAQWKYKTRQETRTNRQTDSPIENFNITDESGEDLTEAIIAHPGYVYLVVAYDLISTNKDAFALKLAPLAEKIEKNGHDFIVLTASPPDIIHAFRENHAAAYPFYLSDERELKTVIRSNPGLVLMKDGVVLGKWPHTAIPSFEYIKNEYKQ